MHPVEQRRGWRSLPPTAQKRDVVTPRRQASKDLVQVDLGPPSLRILEILPVQNEYVH